VTRVPALAVLATLGLAAPPSAAAPRDETAAQASAVERFLTCLRGGACVVDQVFSGAKALRHWERQAGKIKRRPVTLSRAGLHPREPSAEWRTRWLTVVGQLVKTGRAVDRLRHLGAGSALASTGPDEAVALIRTELTPKGRPASEAKTTVLFVTLWRVAGGWRVASWDCAPHLVLKFLVEHRPPTNARR
jgi:hypothetical protein